jgi:hypothetical protein
MTVAKISHRVTGPHTDNLKQNFQIIQPNCYLLVYDVF